MALAAMGLIAALALAAAFWPRGDSAAAAPLVLQFTQLTAASGVEAQPTLSPDGKSVAYASAASGNFDIYLQSVGGQNAINLTKEDDVQYGSGNSPKQRASLRDGFPAWSFKGETTYQIGLSAKF